MESDTRWDFAERDMGMNFWRWLWDGIQEADREAGFRAVAILDRLDNIEPTFARYFVRTYGSGRKEASYVEWRPHSERAGTAMQFAQMTPDGEITTDIWWDWKGYLDRTAGVRVTLQGEGLEGYYFCENRTADPLGTRIMRAKVNKLAVQYLREWLERRAHALQTSLEAVAAKREADNLQERERQEREKRLAVLRKKYLP
jgi:hypothetical protein